MEPKIKKFILLIFLTITFSFILTGCTINKRVDNSVIQQLPTEKNEKIDNKENCNFSFAGEYAMARFSEDPDGEGKASKDTVWLLDLKNKTITPFISEQALNDYFADTLKGAKEKYITTIPLVCLNNSISTIGDFKLLMFNQGIKPKIVVPEFLQKKKELIITCRAYREFLSMSILKTSTENAINLESICDTLLPIIPGISIKSMMLGGKYEKIGSACVSIKIFLPALAKSVTLENDRKKEIENNNICDEIEILNSDNEINSAYNKYNPYFYQYINTANKEMGEYFRIKEDLKLALKTTKSFFDAKVNLDDGCCKYCTTGKACGDSCINVNYRCSAGSGCACDL